MLCETEFLHTEISWGHDFRHITPTFCSIYYFVALITNDFVWLEQTIIHHITSRWTSKQVRHEYSVTLAKLITLLLCIMVFWALDIVTHPLLFTCKLSAMLSIQRSGKSKVSRNERYFGIELSFESIQKSKKLCCVRFRVIIRRVACGLKQVLFERKSHSFIQESIVLFILCLRNRTELICTPNIKSSCFALLGSIGNKTWLN